MWSTAIIYVALGSAVTLAIQYIPYWVSQKKEDERVKNIIRNHPTREQVDRKFEELSLKALTSLHFAEFTQGLAFLRDAYMAGGMWHYLAVFGDINGIYLENLIDYPNKDRTGLKKTYDLYGNQLTELDHWYCMTDPYILALRETNMNFIIKMRQLAQNKIVGAMACGTMHQFRPENKILAQRVYGFDLDKECLERAKKQCLYVRVALKNIMEPFGRKFDIISCLGIDVYLEDDIFHSLLKNFWNHLNAYGVLILSFTRPKNHWHPTIDNNQDNQSKTDLVNRIIPKREGIYRDYDEMKELVADAGFDENWIEFIPDNQEIMPLLITRRTR